VDEVDPSFNCLIHFYKREYKKQDGSTWFQPKGWWWTRWRWRPW